MANFGLQRGSKRSIKGGVWDTGEEFLRDPVRGHDCSSGEQDRDDRGRGEVCAGLNIDGVGRNISHTSPYNTNLIGKIEGSHRDMSGA